MKTQNETVSEILAVLKRFPLFSSLNNSSALLLAQAGKFRTVEKGDVIFFQDDESNSVYLVRSGNIAIMLNSTDGRDMVIDEIREGGIFGHLGVLAKRNRSTSATAHKKSELLTIPGRIFIQIADRDHLFVRHLLDHVVEHLLSSRERESALAFMDAQARLARLLLEMDKQEKDKGYITISQDELAQRTGLIRQTVAKALGKWRRNGLLLTGRGRILLLNHKALRTIENEFSN